MASRSPKIVQAWLETPAAGVIELAHDWRARTPPPFALCHGAACTILAALTRVPGEAFGADSGYFVNDQDELFFFLRLDRHPDIDPAHDVLYVAGDFNGWEQAVGREEWCLVPGRIADAPVLLWSAPVSRFKTAHRFKFVTSAHRWLPVPAGAPNAVRDESGNVNYEFNPDRTGRHLYSFALAAPLDLAEAWKFGWGDAVDAGVPLRPGAFFHELRTDLPLGAIVNGEETTFRLFAPRARRVELRVCADLSEQDSPHRYALQHRPEPGPAGAALPWRGTWELTLEENLHGWFYWYSIEGPDDAFGLFRPDQRVLDPYALAAVDRDGPGIVLDRTWIGRGDRDFKTPAWQDLVIAEAHVRDLAAHAPVRASGDERLGFTGLTKWVESPEFYLHHLGVNAIELQPVQEFDNRTREEYHWGYMTNNYFAPEGSYSLAPLKASGVRELQELVRALHRRGLAVILDVVYNHVGEPAHLMFIDKLYYFEMDGAGKLANWSGCGNDLRCRSAMARRLIIDSLIHLVEAYGVDGFRLDLADLIGLEVLREIEHAVKQVKPDVVLIAEPWSFRGHIAGELRDTGYASWNDGYRNFLREFVRGGGRREEFEYYLKGSPWYYAKWPAQTVNYVESHDDKTWIDLITENADGNGQSPTSNDRRRTHLMAAVLFASIGIPMISAGQDFLRSKQGANNTYQRGDLNALDYRRLYRFPGTHAYFADWIEFRLGPTGRLLRHYARASEGFFRFFFAPDSTAAAVVYNADRSQGGTRLLFAVNPTLQDAVIRLDDETVAGAWRQLADGERFYGGAGRGGAQPVDADLFVPVLGCGLWLAEG
ncbi:MAG TPA: alpha-amylase family glycosyl hydrolase [Opitutaceae bacterium]|nr:alpha-amylase family glycosyl hydrolase [Opitutaceae bacterium]